MEKRGIMFWAKSAYLTTLRAANVKDYKLRRKMDRRFKEIANDLIMGRGYIVATDKELAARYPGMMEVKGSESKKMIWAISFYDCRRGNKMSFVPVR